MGIFQANQHISTQSDVPQRCSRIFGTIGFMIRNDEETMNVTEMSHTPLDS